MTEEKLDQSIMEEISNLLKENSAISIELQKKDVSVKWKDSVDSSKVLKFVIDSRLLLFLLKELNCLKDLSILGEKSAVSYGDSIYAIAGSQRTQTIDIKETKLNIRGTDYCLLVNQLNPVPISLLTKYGLNRSLEDIGTLETIPSLSLHEDTQPTSVKLNERESEYTWKSMVIALLLAHLDPNPKLITIAQRGIPNPIPMLSAGDNFLIHIKPLEEETEEQKKFITSNWESILNYIIFELYKSQELVLQFTDFSQIQTETGLKSRDTSKTRFPEILMYRPINSMLIEYTRVAEETNNEGFRYLSYYHILEHFFRESALLKASEEIQRILLGMDFLSNPLDHTTLIVQKVAQMFPRGEPREEDALLDVLERFLPLDFVEKLIEELKGYIDKKVDFDGDFSLPGVNTKSENLMAELRTRIYRLRNSIVHSKEDYKEGEGHILPTENNKQLLSMETEILKRVVDFVISQSEIA